MIVPASCGLKAGLLLFVLASVAGCERSATIVGTWTRDRESPSDLTEAARFMTYESDGTFHLELYGPDSAVPTSSLKGTYRLDGNHLTTEVPDLGNVGGRAALTDETVTISDEVMTLANDAAPWRRVNYPYHFVDRNLDLVGKWTSKRRAQLELKPDGTFAVNGSLSEAMFSGTAKPDRTQPGGFGGVIGPPRDAHQMGMVAGKIFAEDGTLIAGRGAVAQHAGFLAGEGRGRYTYGGKFLTLEGTFTPSAGKRKGVNQLIEVTMIFHPGLGSTDVLRMMGGTRYQNAGVFLRAK